MRCSRKPCPVVACPSERRRKVGCCEICTGQHRRHELKQGQCWKDRGILKDGQSYKADACTTCTCISGTVVCQRESCPLQIRECNEGESPTQPNSCCRKCFYRKPKNCNREETFRNHGETWQTPGNPCKKCTCVNGTVSCRALICTAHSGACKPGEVYEVVPGKCCKTCIPAPGICSVFGDPHYRTFDGRPFNFQGDCRYVLVKDCKDMNFTVVVQNDAKRSKSFSWTKSVEVELMAMGKMKTTLITLEPHLTVRVNRQKVALPYQTPYVSMNIEKHILKVRTAIGVSLNWDGDSFLEVGAAPMYRNKLCGLCGNYNTFKRDDFIGGDKTFKYSEMSFGNSWIVDNDSCSRDDDKPDTTRCKKSLLHTLKARRSCALFKSNAFSKCYQKIDPTEYYKSCVTDSCECPVHKKCACEALVAYTTACERKGVKIYWDRSSYCKKTCSRGKVFSTCGPACRDKCRNYEQNKHKNCKKKCVAGCHCPAGTVLHRRRCIKVSQCPKYQDTKFSIIISRRDAKRHHHSLQTESRKFV